MDSSHRPDVDASDTPPGCTLLPSGAGETLHVLRDAATFKVGPRDGAGRFSVVEVTAAPGSGVPLHSHADADEALYVLDGTFAVRIGGAHELLESGASAFIVRGTPHAFVNAGAASARVLVVSSPATTPTRQFTELASAFTEGTDGGDELRDAFREVARMRGVGLG